MDIVIRVIVISHEGRDHLKILRRIAKGKTILTSTNHTIPLFREFVYEDIVFGIFPKIGARVSEIVGRWAKNSVGDVIEMVMQMLEVCAVLSGLFTIWLSLTSQALAFIHYRRIAHRVCHFSYAQPFCYWCWLGHFSWQLPHSVAPRVPSHQHISISPQSLLDWLWSCYWIRSGMHPK